MLRFAGVPLAVALGLLLTGCDGGGSVYQDHPGILTVSTHTDADKYDGREDCRKFKLPPPSLVTLTRVGQGDWSYYTVYCGNPTPPPAPTTPKVDLDLEIN